MTASLSRIARLQKLLLMLSSERDGEVINAARLIGHTLQTIGADWHDLATGLLAPPANPQTKEPRDDESNDWRAMRRFCNRHSEFLSAREKAFITNIGSWRGDLTPKQHDWLAAIHARLQREAV